MCDEPPVEDDLLDDLMNIVHNEGQDQAESNEAGGLMNAESGGDTATGGGEFENEFDDDLDDDSSIDELLEKPIDILDDKKDNQVNFYTYDKVQIKSKISRTIFSIQFYIKVVKSY